MFTNGAPWAQQHSFNTTQSGDISGSWTAGVALPGVRGYHCAVFVKRYVWLIGGMSTTSAFRQNSYRGTVDSSGVVTSWSTISNFPFSRAHASAVVVGGYVYVVGGFEVGIDSDTILRATIDASGVIGTFTEYSVALPSGRSGHKCAVIKSKLYVFGGSGTDSSNVLVSDISTDGGLGEFSVAGTVTAYPYQTIAITSTKVYLIGGSSGISYPTAIQSAAINSDGTLGTFSVETNLNSAIGYSCEIVSAANIHTFGGRQSNTTYLSALNRLLLSGGSIASQDVVDYYLLSARYGHTAIATSSRIYVFGGINSSNTFLSTTEYTSYTGGLNDYSPYLEEDEPLYGTGVTDKDWPDSSGIMLYPYVFIGVTDQDAPESSGYVDSNVVSGRVEHDYPDASGQIDFPIVLYGDTVSSEPGSIGYGAMHAGLYGETDQECPSSAGVCYSTITTMAGNAFVAAPKQSTGLLWTPLMFGSVSVSPMVASGAIDYPVVMIGRHHQRLSISSGKFYIGGDVFAGAVIQGSPIASGVSSMDSVMFGDIAQGSPASYGELDIQVTLPLRGDTIQMCPTNAGVAMLGMLLSGSISTECPDSSGIGHISPIFSGAVFQDASSINGKIFPYNRPVPRLSFGRCSEGATATVGHDEPIPLHYSISIGKAPVSEPHLYEPLTFIR